MCSVRETLTEQTSVKRTILACGAARLGISSVPLPERQHACRSAKVSVASDCQRRHQALHKNNVTLLNGLCLI
jgi:hypothetical protein